MRNCTDTPDLSWLLNLLLSPLSATFASPSSSPLLLCLSVFNFVSVILNQGQAVMFHVCVWVCVDRVRPLWPRLCACESQTVCEVTTATTVTVSNPPSSDSLCLPLSLLPLSSLLSVHHFFLSPCIPQFPLPVLAYFSSPTIPQSYPRRNYCLLKMPFFTVTSQLVFINIRISTRFMTAGPSQPIDKGETHKWSMLL